ncbi:zinc-dependent metalloprotease [uncultured Jatrophihabitans sp.]|uniref:zinc-dependent metalloprotease n=1 Tax=uncultured Jatrophihabitans sp. TaxID=1610747 RepID=UPI0035CA49EA
MASLIDWDLAARTAKRFSPASPGVSRREADDVVGELYRATAAAADHVAQLTHLQEPPVTAATRVVDRAGWIDANAGGLRTIMDPLVDRLTAANPVGKFGEAVGGRITGAQVGGILGFLSGKVLGQFEFFDRPGGQLLLVAPNLVAVERLLQVDPHDFRLWVCLHEVTHRVQFTAVPWLRQHMLGEVAALGDTFDTDPAELRRRLSGAASELVKAVRGQGDGSGLLTVLATPEQRVVIERVTAFMSLVEGHAEYVMNAVPSEVIPSQQVIESRFAVRRRRGGNPLDRLLRRLLGLDAKTRQYVDGSAFVRSVVERIGVDDFNAIWTSVETLPTRAEIAEPARWIARVHA